ncbi:polycystic kidney disease protein 1-like 2 [Micropterus salmoides]|uniref:polycystic kidney disease protein 1-like 2 n=1 Tax=Micropterus salmoides TaxID=27706 RepID=UPI0018ECB0EF|nr:polycystic kidney disease protein 1-like 2 [Micropterus salmoides]
MSLDGLSCAADKTKLTVSCPEYQKALGDSCYEFVGLQHTFFSAQAWCEKRGAHLAFVPDEETQHFLQRHLDSKKDVWLGLAPSAVTSLQYSPTVEGPLSWLDGSQITYSNWVSSPQPGAACGLILGNSSFQWKATRDCNKELHFICQFQSGRSTVCAGHNTTLQCGSGQVLMIDDSFYGRKNIYYCRSTHSQSTSATPTQHQCGWVDVAESLTAHCHGRQVCQISEVMDSFGEPCPQLGSYLSLDYHCKDGLTLSAIAVAAVFDDITITVKWLLDLPRGNLSCKLSTGDGHVIYLHSPEGLESIVVYKYIYPSTFVVAVECTSSEMHIVAQKIITIQEPITQFGIIRCCAGKLCFHATNCKALYGEPFQTQMEVKAGTNVTYRIQSAEILLSGLSVVRGNVPQNITVTPEMVKQLGPGCHKLTLYASNMVTFPDVSADLQMCVLEKVAGLQASVLTERDDCLDSADITVGVSLERGAPVLLLFSLAGDNSSFSETREMNSKKEIFHIGHPIQDVVALCNKFTIETSSSSSSSPTTKPASTTTLHGTISATTISSTTAGSATTSHGTISATTISSTAAGSATTSHGTISATTTAAGSATTSHGTISATTISSTAAGSATTLHSTISATTTAAGSATTLHGTISATTTAAGSATTLHGTISATTTAAGSATTSHGTISATTIATVTTSPALSASTGVTSSATTTKNGAFSTMASSSSVDDLTASVENAVAQLKKQGLLSGANLGQIIYSVSTTLNGQSDKSTKADRQKLREQMLGIMTDTISKIPPNTPADVQAITKGVSALVQKGTELSSSAQVEASLLFANLSSSLLHMNLNKSEESKNEIFSATSTIVEGASNILDYSSNMLSLGKNPFSWKERGNISGLIGALSLTTKDGSAIPVANLSQDIEILLPRPVEEQVNTSVLDLGNYSTTSINILSANTTLVLKMVPSVDPLPFKLFLGYMNYPTETNYAAMTDMPQQGTTQEERYTWLLDPAALKGNTGKYYLVVRPIVGPGIKSINATLSITSIATSCTFWNKSALDWSNFGCRVGVQTTPLVTQCLCNHLTFFGSSFFVTPNTVDPSRTAELFGTFAQNPVVVCFVGALFVVYLLVVVWARRKDIQDMAKVKVTVLADNNPMDEYCYLLSVSTGHRRGACTSSQVIITLLGAEGNGEPHHLTDPKKCLFERAAVDMFLITAPFSLGDLQAIRLWHNNSGSHPAWYIGSCMVQDLQTEQKWHFLCNSWLAIDMGDCSLDKVFPVSTDVDLKRFSNLFFMKTTKAFTDGHLWYSVVNRPPSSTFTCVQRVSCCFSLLLCTMLTSIMFYGIPKDPSEQTMELGHFKFTWQHFRIGIQSSLIMFPLNILIVSIFRKTPRKVSINKHKTKKTDTLQHNVNITLDVVIEDITRIARLLSKTVKSNKQCLESELRPGQQVDIHAVLSVVEDFIKQNNKTCDTVQSKSSSFQILAQPQLPEGSAHGHPGATLEGIQKKSYYLYRQLCHIEKKLSQLGPSGFPNPHSYSQALQQVRGMKGLLEDQLNLDDLTQKRLIPADSAGDNGVMKRLCCHGELPWWFIFVGWLLVIGTSVVAGYFTMLYGLKYGKERSVSWLVSMVVSFFHSLLVIQPLKVIGLAIFFSLIIKEVEVEDFRNVPFVENDGNKGDTDQQKIRRDSSLYEPPSPADVEKMKRNKIMNQKAIALLREILTYIGFLWMLLLVAYGRRDPNAFFLNQHIQDSFSREISDSMNLGDVFTWANTSLLNNLFGVYPGFITDGNSKLVGDARLRQLRVQKNSCQIAGSMLQFVPDCHAPYSWEVEDMGSYEPGWNHSVRDNISTSTSSPWKYQTQAQLRAYPVWGEMVLYRGGGFVSELGPDLQNASNTLEYLFRNKWLDTYTRAIFIEFTVYNANVNLFCIVTLLLETTAVGAFQFHSELHSVRLYTSTGDLYSFVVAAEVIYLLFILYYMFLQGKLMKQQRWAYFRSKWNLLELTVILLSWSAVAVFIKRTLLGNRDITYYQNHKDKFASFYETATADSTLEYLIAFLVLLATIKLWHLLRLNPKMNLVSAALQRAWNETSSIIVVIAIMLVAYSIACNLIYGWRMSSYRTVADALMTIILLQIGIFNYDEVLDSTPLLGGLLFGSCIVFMTFVVLNLLISMVLMAFTQEQIYHKASDEEEIVDLMLKKICGLFGIRYNNTNDTRGSDVNEGSGLTLNNSRNIINSSADVKQHLTTHRNP